MLMASNAPVCQDFAKTEMIMVNSNIPSIPVEPRLNDYDFVRFLTRSRVAWEYLRRNQHYRREWRTSFAGRSRPVNLVGGTVLLRARRRVKRAEVWGLHMFRQS